MARKLMLELEQIAHYANEMEVQCKCKTCVVDLLLDEGGILTSERCINPVPFISPTELCEPCVRGDHKRSMFDDQ
jgi:hypothetical protein